jgi:hypothetical protein
MSVGSSDKTARSPRGALEGVDAADERVLDTTLLPTEGN